VPRSTAGSGAAERGVGDQRPCTGAALCPPLPTTPPCTHASTVHCMQCNTCTHTRLHFQTAHQSWRFHLAHMLRTQRLPCPQRTLRTQRLPCPQRKLHTQRLPCPQRTLHTRTPATHSPHAGQAAGRQLRMIVRQGQLLRGLEQPAASPTSAHVFACWVPNA